MTEREREIRQRLKDDFVHYAAKCLKIRAKSGKIEPFTLNSAQRHIHERIEKQRKMAGRVRAIILKGRQQGCSTYVEGRFYWLVTHRKGVRAFILTHEAEATNNLFEIAQRYHTHCPQPVRPDTGAANAKELHFADIDSGYKVGTAGTKGVGRSSTIQLFHGSEAGYWPFADTHAAGILQAVPDEPGTELILESTANGIGNYFHQQWQQAESEGNGWIAVFIPWFWQQEYRSVVPDGFAPTAEEVKLASLHGLDNAQLVWRRHKVTELAASGGDGVKAFQQEYPCTPVEAFQVSGEDSLIDGVLVTTARKNTQVQAIGPLLIGVDPARFGDDRTSIIRRRGRKAFTLTSRSKLDTMEVAGLVHTIILEERPARVFVDVVGLGAGVVDRLRELGHGAVVVPVSGAESPLNEKKYVNKRDEMWALMALWLKDAPCQIPDIDSLHTDLCGVRYRYDSNGRMKLEGKDEMKRRGLRSPDEADALALTFALGASPAVGVTQTGSMRQKLKGVYLR